ncbi:hypothetical protein BU26DRAFT_525266 [Trematosphaeria pertusa]|uniref:Uncharacterized protein n=1 Tax=Trematosphaeria pertusa TaxID=390896 RepID=A0A6A6HTV4_9PLEO|nr:uncharacterized protein BU26DRAFT_525266 [Trematosphaeria pertusa]KAF2241441.1 hypothetical protein BU26DRAFT_525266 [Trematosphaeria pertusa]
MCKYTMQKIKPGGCKAVPPHVYTEKQITDYCDKAPAKNNIPCDNQVENTATHITITAAGQGCSECGT